MSGTDFVKKVTSTFEEANAMASLKSCKVTAVKGSKVEVENIWNQDCLHSEKKLSLFSSQAFDLQSQDETSSGVHVLPDEEIMAKEGDLKVQIQKVKMDGQEKDILRLLKENRMIKSFNLTDLDLHGSVYFDAELGGITIKSDVSGLAFIAEKKKEKSRPFFKHQKPNENSSVAPGQEYKFRDEFGEQMVGKSKPVIVYLNLFNYEFKVIDSKCIPDGWAPGQLTFFKDDLLCSAIYTQPRILGLVYCSNRTKAIFKINLSDMTCHRLSADNDKISACSPRVCRDNDNIIWLERDLVMAGKFPGPHECYKRIMKMDSKGQVSVLMDIKENYDDNMEYVSKTKNCIFKGIYESSLPNRCFLNKGTLLAFSTVMQATVFPVLIRISDGRIFVQNQNPNVKIHDCFESVVSAGFSDFLSPSKSIIGRLEDNEIKFMNCPKSSELIELMTMTPKAVHGDEKYRHVDFNAIYVSPKGKLGPKSVPLIVWPHGGPHSVIPNSFVNNLYFFHLCGYAMLFVNYRGSLGNGQDSVNSLPGNVGDLDVKDCHQSTMECLEKHPEINPNKVVLHGGSHGGFLVTHLAGQYPDLYKGVVARNPVTNIATEATVSDIPDWCWNENGSSYDFAAPINANVLKSMLEKSPMAHIQKVKAPIYLMLGKNDLRVPPSQGLDYYHTLKAMGKKVQLNIYDDNHPLAKVANNANAMINCALFYNNC